MSDGAIHLRAEVRSFLTAESDAERFRPRVNSWMDGHDPEFSRRLGEHGWIGMTWPTRYGGGARTALERHAVTEEVLAAGAPVAAQWFADRQIGPQLLTFGSEDQRERYLPAIAAGETYFAVGLSEPDAGSDLAAIRTVAEPVPGGWKVRGAKIWTSHADRCQYMMTLCRTSPRGENRHEGLSQMIVDLSAEGVTINPIENLDGAAHFCEVVLDEVFVAAEDLVGAEGNGWKQVTSELAFERSGPERFMSTVALVREAVAIAGADVDRAESERIGRVFGRLMALRRLSYGVVAELQRGVPDDARAALVKDLGTRTEQDLVEELRIALDQGDRAPAAYARALAESQLAAPTFTLRGGSTEILQSIVARELVNR